MEGNWFLVIWLLAIGTVEIRSQNDHQVQEINQKINNDGIIEASTDSVVKEDKTHVVDLTNSKNAEKGKIHDRFTIQSNVAHHNSDGTRSKRNILHGYPSHRGPQNNRIPEAAVNMQRLRDEDAETRNQILNAGARALFRYDELASQDEQDVLAEHAQRLHEQRNLPYFDTQNRETQ